MEIFMSKWSYLCQNGAMYVKIELYPIQYYPAEETIEWAKEFDIPVIPLYMLSTVKIPLFWLFNYNMAPEAPEIQ